MKAISVLLVLVLVHSGSLDCREIGECKRVNLDGCETLHNPFPFIWEATVTLTKDYTWHGLDDVFFIYSNPDSFPIKANCTTAVPLPGQYKAGDHLSIQQTCYSFDKPLKKGSHVSFWMFYSYEKFPD
jgi:hypothetical protein